MPKNPPTPSDQPTEAHSPESGDVKALTLPEVPPKKSKTQVAVDFQAFLKAEEAETEGVDAVLHVPEFTMDEAGKCSLAEDQSNAISVRVLPFLGAAVLDAIASSDSLSGARILEALIHADDIPLWRARIRDASRPVPVTWIAAATKGLLRAHGIGSDVEPGKGSS